MAISRAQMEEQIKGFQAGDLATTDPFELDQAKQDAFGSVISPTPEIDRSVTASNLDQASALVRSMNELRSGLGDKEDEARLGDSVGTTYEERFKEYQDQLRPILSGEKRGRNIYDLAAALGQGLLSSDPTTGAFAGLGAGFTLYNQQMKKQRETLQAEQRAIALKAFELAREDEKAALEFANEREIQRIKNATTKQKYTQWVIPERDASGQETGKFIKRSAADTDLALQELYSSLGGYPATGGDTITVGGSVASEFAKTLGKKSADAIAKWEEEASLAINQKNLLDTAKAIVEDIPASELGILQDLTLPMRKLLSDFGVIEREGIKDQELVKSFGTRIAMGLIGQTKGAISNAEMSLFLASSPGLAMTKEGYQELIGYLDRINQKQIDFKTAFDKAMVDGEFDAALQSGDDAKISAAVSLWQKNWHADNALFSKEEAARLKREHADKEDPQAKKFRENYLKYFGMNNNQSPAGDDVSSNY
mgnify:FL=1|tara:strand:+ start:166 stop:1608 length:1443 start_codon:yes stop_codon:yes gene_type:complete